MSRLEFSRRTKLAAWQRATGPDGKQRCECDECGGTDPTQGILICVKGPHYDHHIPDQIRPDNSLENCRVLNVACHRRKTGTIDAPRIAKARSVTAGHARAKSSTPRTGRGKNAALKKMPDGRVVDRATGKQIWP